MMKNPVGCNRPVGGGRLKPLSSSSHSLTVRFKSHHVSLSLSLSRSLGLLGKSHNCTIGYNSGFLIQIAHMIRFLWFVLCFIPFRCLFVHSVNVANWLQLELTFD